MYLSSLMNFVYINITIKYDYTNKTLVYSWCKTCASWKKELEAPSNMRPPAGSQAQWDKMTSWEWPASPANIVQVFIQPGFNTIHINLLDLSTSLSILRRCARVPPNTTTVADTLRELRNGIVHAGTLKVDDSTRDDIFVNIRNLLSDNDVKPSIANFDSVMGNIDKLANGKLERICKWLKL